MDAEHKAEGQEGMPGTPGENETPSQHEGAADASVPRSGEDAGGTVTALPGEGGASGAEASGGEAPPVAESAAQGTPAGENHAGESASVQGPGPGGEGPGSVASPDAPGEGSGSTVGSEEHMASTAAQGEVTGFTGEGEPGEGAKAGRYVELGAAEGSEKAPDAALEGGAVHAGPVSGADAALLSAGIWDVASRASQEDAGPVAAPREEPEGSNDSNDEAATPEGETSVEAQEPRVMGQVTAMVLPLERLEEDTTFRLRDEGDVSELATDLARLGQLFPVDVRPRGEERYQLICGFRRVAALRFLKRDQVQVRVHEDLSDEDALLLSLAEAIHASPVEHDVLEAKRGALEAEGRLTAPVRDMLEKALATEETLAPEGVEEEVDADELAADVARRMGDLNQELSLLADVFAALDESRKAELLMQLRYSSQLVAYLEGL
jgi:ParB-like chromosome segregation protein Spo0J